MAKIVFALLVALASMGSALPALAMTGELHDFTEAPDGGTIISIPNGLPDPRMPDTLVCVGPPDATITGSDVVTLMGVPAAVMGDNTAHGGEVILGSEGVTIGD